MLFFAGGATDRRPPGERFDAAHAGRDAALVHDLADADIAGAAHVRAAAQFPAERPSPTDTTRTLSPYFSPNSAMAPVFSASSMLITSVRTSSFARICFVDQPLDLLQLLAVDRGVVREVEAQTRGLDDAAGLLHMRAEDLAQRGVQQVRRRVIAHRRHALFSVDDGLDDGVPAAIGATVRTRCTFRPFTGAIRARTRRRP